VLKTSEEGGQYRRPKPKVRVAGEELVRITLAQKRRQSGAEPIALESKKGRGVRGEGKEGGHYVEYSHKVD